MIQIQQRGSVMHQKLHTKCTVMERRTMTMDWEGLLDDDDDDRFFESFDRLSSAVPIDLASSGSDDDEGDDSRTSFASAMSSAPIHNMRGIDPARAQASMLRDFNMWMAEPGSIKERRRRLLQGMGLSSNKNLLSRNNTRLKDSSSKRMNYDRDQPSTMSVNNSSPLEDLKLDASPSPSPSSTPIFLIRSRSDGDIESFSANTDYVHVPETVFSLSERPVCSFTGHLDDVLDLSWSKSHVSFSPRLILKLVEPMGSFPSLLTRAEEKSLITMDILLSLLPFFRQE